MLFSDADICAICGGYDTIQTYIPYTEENPVNGKIKRFFHVCEACSDKHEQAELVEIFNRKRGKI